MLLGKNTRKKKKLKTALNKKQSQSAVSRNRTTGILSLYESEALSQKLVFFLPFMIGGDIMRGSREEPRDCGVWNVT